MKQSVIVTIDSSLFLDDVASQNWHLSQFDKLYKAFIDISGYFISPICKSSSEPEIFAPLYQCSFTSS